MSPQQHAHTWPIARLLFATHLPFLMLMWVAFMVIVGVIIAGVAVFGTITSSGWDVAGSVLRWFAAGYGFYLAGHFLPVLLAHGQTRREFMVQVIVFIVVTAAVLAVLITLGYALESVVYAALDWPQVLSDQRLFAAPTQFGLIFVMFWVLLLIWTITGMLLAAAFHRSEGWGLGAIPLALLLVLGAGISVGYSALPFVGALGRIADVSLPVTMGLGAGTFLLGVAITWAVVHDLPLRN